MACDVMGYLSLIGSQKPQSSYKPDLDEFLSQCEVNYALILRLLPWLNVGKNDQLTDFEQQQIKFRPTSGHKIDLKLIEKARYTTTMMLRVYSPSRTAEADINLMVRLYHDAQLVEVMDRAGPKALIPKNKGTTLRTRQVDEKRQLNRFLGESLRYCLNGYGLNGCTYRETVL